MARSVTLIPAKPRTVGKEANKETKLRLAAYCRVSSSDEDQLHSYDAQIDYYKNYVESHPQYTLVEIYGDRAISGTGTRKRKEFMRMIEDCSQGKIDAVVTKSISRFARNTRDCLEYVRLLKGKGIPVIFEKENIITTEQSGELLLTVLSSLAQDESRNTSENSTWGIRTKFKKGELHLNTSHFLGYDKDASGNLVINEEQAQTVRRIYREFLDGRNPQEIAKGLEDDGVLGCSGRSKWFPCTIVGILRNEKHVGDALLQKTYTASFLTKKQIRNDGTVPQVFIKDNHQGIIDRETWDAVQEELKRREEFIKRHGLTSYSRGTEPNAFSFRVFCGECGSPYTRHSWSPKGIHQWQCREHRVNGILKCGNGFVRDADLRDAFV